MAISGSHTDDRWQHDHLERARRRRSFAVPGSPEDEEARRDALDVDSQLTGRRRGSRWLGDAFLDEAGGAITGSADVRGG